VWDLPFEPSLAGRAAVEKAANAIKLPYDKDKAIAVAGYGSRTTVFAGPGNLLIALHTRERRLSAYKPGSVDAVWEYKVKSRSFPQIPGHDGQAHTAFMDFGSKTSGVIVSLADGRQVRTVPSHFRTAGLAAGWRMGSFWLVPYSSRFYLVDTSSFKILEAPSTCSSKQLLGRNGNLVYYMGRKQLGRVDVAQLYRKSSRMKQLDEQRSNLNETHRHLDWKTRSTLYQNLGRQWSQCEKEARGLFKDYFVPDLAPGIYYSPGRSYYIPGTERVVVGMDVWAVGARSAKKVGRLNPVRHSGAVKKWYYAFAQLKDNRPAEGLLSISPDGKYAMTHNHLFELKTFKPVVELPLPTQKGGFLSGGKTIYLYDRHNQKVWFVEIAKLLKEGGKPLPSGGTDAAK